MRAGVLAPYHSYEITDLNLEYLPLGSAVPLLSLTYVTSRAIAPFGKSIMANQSHNKKLMMPNMTNGMIL
jgi:hypothetical protein